MKLLTFDAEYEKLLKINFENDITFLYQRKLWENHYDGKIPWKTIFQLYMKIKKVLYIQLEISDLNSDDQCNIESVFRLNNAISEWHISDDKQIVYISEQCFKTVLKYTELLQNLMISKEDIVNDVNLEQIDPKSIILKACVGLIDDDDDNDDDNDDDDDDDDEEDDNDDEEEDDDDEDYD